MPPALVQTATPAATTTTPTTVNFGTATVAGQLIVVTASNDSGGVLVTGVTDNKGNTYSRATSGGGQSLEIWYCLITTGGSSHSVSVAWSLASASHCAVA